MKKDDKAVDSKPCNPNLTDAHDQKEGRKMAQEPTQTKMPNSTKSSLVVTPLNGWQGKPNPGLGSMAAVYLRKDLPEPPKKSKSSRPEEEDLYFEEVEGSDQDDESDEEDWLDDEDWLDEEGDDTQSHGEPERYHGALAIEDLPSRYIRRKVVGWKQESPPITLMECTQMYNNGLITISEFIQQWADHKERFDRELEESLAKMGDDARRVITGDTSKLLICLSPNDYPREVPKSIWLKNGEPILHMIAEHGIRQLFRNIRAILKKRKRARRKLRNRVSKA